MQWHLKSSEKVGKGTQTKREWAELLRKDGREEDALLILDEEPELFADLSVYWNAFHILSSSRSSGMGVGAIPLPAYESYFRIMGIDSLDEKFRYLKFVGVLDNEYLKWHGEKNEKEQQKREAKNKAKSHPMPHKR